MKKVNNIIHHTFRMHKRKPESDVLKYLINEPSVRQMKVSDMEHRQDISFWSGDSSGEYYSYSEVRIFDTSVSVRVVYFGYNNQNRIRTLFDAFVKTVRDLDYAGLEILDTAASGVAHETTVNELRPLLVSNNTPEAVRAANTIM